MKLTRRLLPRLFFLLTALMLVSALSWAMLFVYSEQAPRARNFAQVLSSIVNLTRSAVVAADPLRRNALLLDLTNQEGVRIYPAEPGEPPVAAPQDPFLRDVLQNLRNSLGPDTQLTTERYGDTGVFVLADIEGEDYWIGLPRKRLEGSRSLQWLGWGALGALIALLTAAGFVSRLTRPLKRLTEAARVVGEGRYPEPLPEDGPEELATVATAFNKMNKDLERQEQDRALILAGISHDLRTPLTRLRMGIEMSEADEATRDGMVADTEEIDRTIGQFLDFARSNESANLEPVPLKPLLEDIAGLYQRRGITLHTELMDVGEIPMNPATLRRAVSNLIDNAIRHAGKESITLSVQDKLTAVVVDVADRGPGIPVAETDRMMQPFTRLEAARSNTAGAGLGLAIVSRIATQHGGKLELLPRQEGGLIARIRLPRR